MDESLVLWKARKHYITQKIVINFDCYLNLKLQNALEVRSRGSENGLLLEEGQAHTSTHIFLTLQRWRKEGTRTNVECNTNER